MIIPFSVDEIQKLLVLLHIFPRYFLEREREKSY